ncbi:hypothetical protein [Acinetobacter radioresistens]|uniref:hypothetical protein n=1 Tax=Acinetobacter radioresistens TaxID=40216 RepID=UPI0002FDE31E|nr:hypothetical protein [Acinetobacter radioresistens]
MKEYIQIAETVYDRVHKRNGFQGDSYKDIDILLIEIKKEIKGSGIRFKYNFNDFDELCKEIDKKNGKRIDMSLMPSRRVRDEFVLWLAAMFATIIDKVSIEAARTPAPRPKLENNGEAITAHLKSLKRKPVR